MRALHPALTAVLALATACTPSRPRQASHAPVSPHTVRRYDYRVVAVFPHDPGAFTQGFTYVEGTFLEGTGLHGRSSLRQVEVHTGRILRSLSLGPEHFGEGIAVDGTRVVQLTYRSKTGFVYDLQTFEPLGSFSYHTEGWGITYDGSRFVMSDGTPVLRFLNPHTFAVEDSVVVTLEGKPLWGLNELEYVEGTIMANVWPSSRIVLIEPATGRVGGVVDLEGILPKEDLAGADVLNGIAYDPEGRRLFVTGKFWPSVIQIELVEEP